MEKELEKYKLSISELRKVKSLAKLSDNDLHEIRDSLFQFSYICYKAFENGKKLSPQIYSIKKSK